MKLKLKLKKTKKINDKKCMPPGIILFTKQQDIATDRQTVLDSFKVF